MSFVRVERLSKRFYRPRPWRELLRGAGRGDEIRALDDVSFEVGKGEVFGLLGPNGAGKTTLFKILSTLLLPDAGQATVDGHDVATSPTEVRERLVPVLANERSLSWRLSVRENLRLYSALQGLHGANARAAEARVMEVTDLTPVAGTLVGVLSSGMRQRVLLARALLGRPTVLLLDEPTRSLDPIAARDFRRFIRDRIVGGEGCTVLLATHDADDVWDLCARVGVLHRGRLLRVTAASQLHARFAVLDYDVVVRQDALPAVQSRAERAGLSLQLPHQTSDDGWLQCSLRLSSAPEAAAAALRALAGDDAGELAAFSRRLPTLAELIEHTVAEETQTHA